MATLAPNPRSTPITLASETEGPFDVGFRLFEADSITVYVNGVSRTDWTLTATFVGGYDDSATILFTNPLSNGDTLLIDGWLTPARNADYLRGDPGLTDQMNTELPRAWAALQELKREAGRSIRAFDDLPPFEVINDRVLSFRDGAPVLELTYDQVLLAEGYSQSAGGFASAAAGSAASAALYDGPKFDRVAAMLADAELTYTAGSASSVEAGDVVSVREAGFGFAVQPAGAAAHNPVTTPDGWWLQTAAPGLIKTRGFQVPTGGFDIRQFGAKCDGSNDSAAINAALLVASGCATYTDIGDPFKAAASAPLHLPSGKIGFTETLVLQPYVHLIGGGHNNSILHRIGGTGHSLQSVNFDALEADPLAAALPPGIGLQGLTVMDGAYTDGPSTGYGVALHGFARQINDVVVFCPKREKGLYVAGSREASAAVSGISSLYPWRVVEDVLDQVWAVRNGGDGITLKTNDMHFGRIWSAVNRGRGVVLSGNSMHGDYLHAYSNYLWNAYINGPEISITELEVRDGLEGGAALLANDIYIGKLRANNNKRFLDGAWTHTPTIGYADQPDLLIANRNIGIKNADITVSRGGVGILYDNTLTGSVISHTDISAWLDAPSSGTYVGKGVGVKFAVAGYPNRLKAQFRSFNDASALGVHIITGAGQTGLDLHIDVAEYGSGKLFTALKLDAGVFKSDVKIHGNSSQITDLKTGVDFDATNRVAVFDRASNRQVSRININTANIAVDSTGVKTATITIAGGWIGGQTPVANAGTVLATLLPSGAYHDFVADPPLITIGATTITVAVNIRTASATAGATARVNVFAMIGMM